MQERRRNEIRNLLQDFVYLWIRCFSIVSDHSPLCVEKLEKNDNFKDTYIKIISIQKCLHRNFNELEFDFVDGKLTYKFIKGLHKNDFSNLN